jgi:hypothetical protein
MENPIDAEANQGYKQPAIDQVCVLTVLEAEALSKLKVTIADNERMRKALAESIRHRNKVQEAVNHLSEPQRYEFSLRETQFFIDLEHLYAFTANPDPDLLRSLADKYAADISSLAPALAEAINEQYAFDLTTEGSAALEFLETMERIDRARLELRIKSVSLSES